MADATVQLTTDDVSTESKQKDSSLSLSAVVRAIVNERRIAGIIFGGLLLACFAYCLFAPRQYESHARLALRTAPITSIHLDESDAVYSGSFASGLTQLETLAGVLRSDQLAWNVIVAQKLYQTPSVMGGFAARFPDFHPEAASAGAQAYLLERFSERLRVRTIPRTLLVDVRFRCGDPVMAAAVVSRLINEYERQESRERTNATEEASGWLRSQLDSLRSAADAADQRLAEGEKQQGIVATIAPFSSGDAAAGQHVPGVLQLDETGRQLVSATSYRIEREAQFRAAEQGNPEQVLAADSQLQNDGGALSIAAFRQIESRRSELNQEAAQLSAEHGPNFPRTVEIRHQLEDLDRQLAMQRTQLRGRFKSAWQTALIREQELRKSFDAQTAEQLRANSSILRLEAMRHESEARRAVYLRVRDKIEEANLAAGVHIQAFSVIDAARVPSKPSSPNWQLSFAITLFVAMWVAVNGALFAQLLRRRAIVSALVILSAFFASSSSSYGQAPTPSTSGLPTGVARIPAAPDNRATPNAAEAPPVWSGAGVRLPVNDKAAQIAHTTAPAPIGPGDLVEVSEFHTPEFHTMARVSVAGAITLPMVGEVTVLGMDEEDVAQAVAAAFVQKGILLHPQVFVLVSASSAKEVAVMGEVMRPGNYPYDLHHRLLDLLSAASGLTPTAGSLVYIAHRDSKEPAHAVALDPTSASSSDDHNPELLPGDTVHVTRGGLVYVVGDVIRPGGFVFDSTHPSTVLQALSLAWGPSHSAALGKAILIREQTGGRTITRLNLKRILRGQEPDLPVQERDILYVPNSAAKNLWNRTAESVVQSVAGVSIYSGLVYSQRY